MFSALFWIPIIILLYCSYLAYKRAFKGRNERPPIENYKICAGYATVAIVTKLLCVIANKIIKGLPLTIYKNISTNDAIVRPITFAVLIYLGIILTLWAIYIVWKLCSRKLTTKNL